MNKLISKFFGQYKTEALLLLGAFVLYKAWGFFTGLGNIGDTVAAAVAGATANAQQASKEAQQKAQVKAVNAKATAADLSTFERDAETLAAACGANSSFFMNNLNTDWLTAYQVAKRYSRRVVYVQNGKLVDIGERKTSLQLPVLTSFYKTASKGRSLMADLDAVMRYAPKVNQDYYKKYIK